MIGRRHNERCVCAVCDDMKKDKPMSEDEKTFKPKYISSFDPPGTLKDNVNHPKHYNSHPSGIECIQVTRHMNFNLGNVFKYLWRTDHKNGLEDLKKARWYLDDEIARLEGKK